MQKQSNVAKKSDVILGLTALVVVSGLCIKGAYSLYFDGKQAHTHQTRVIVQNENHKS